MRIALLAVLAFAGVWLVALRPKPVAGPADPAPIAATTQAAKPAKPAKPAKAAKGNGILSASDKAKQAVATGNAAAAKTEATAKATGGTATTTAPAKPAKAAAAKPATAAAATPATAAKPATTAAATPATTAAKPEVAGQSAAVREILAELDGGKVVVLLFWEPKGSDDRAVRSAVARTNLHGGKVETHVASIDDLADYAPITRGVPVVTSPSVVVIDKNRRARVIAGLTIPREIDQTVARALKGN